MNKFELKTQQVSGSDILKIDGIEFSKAIFVNILIDSSPIAKLKFLDIALVVFTELARSLSGSGRYLIFTSASGIADDGGWEGVAVTWKDGVVYWDFEVEEESYQFEFEQSQYIGEIQNLEKELAGLTSDLKLEPTELFFPENWDM